jgi:hypothetical protein
MYGFFIKINEVSINTSQEFVHTALLLLFVVAGIKYNYMQVLVLFWLIRIKWFGVA